MLFISFEGGEGVGKTTQAARLIERLNAARRACILVREPGSTPLGNRLRESLKRGGEAKPAVHAELFLFAAARAELVTKVLHRHVNRPDLVIVADRFADSTIAYQGYGRGIPLAGVAAVNALATRGLAPDVTFLLDCEPEIGISRVRGFQMQLPFIAAPPRQPDFERVAEGASFEEEPHDFHDRVRFGFLETAKKEPDRWRVLDATGTVEDISAAIWDETQARIEAATP